jgi:hypothetical protein
LVITSVLKSLIYPNTKDNSAPYIIQNTFS